MSFPWFEVFAPMAIVTSAGLGLRLAIDRS